MCTIYLTCVPTILYSRSTQAMQKNTSDFKAIEVRPNQIEPSWRESALRTPWTHLGQNRTQQGFMYVVLRLTVNVPLLGSLRQGSQHVTTKTKMTGLNLNIPNGPTHFQANTRCERNICCWEPCRDFTAWHKASLPLRDEGIWGFSFLQRCARSYHSYRIMEDHGRP